jgi:glycosyltransferase involved in cell wall biosynthesis
MSISVCMATYNGARYVGRQIASILPQLAAADELIVCDDGSADETVEIVRGFGDPRIRLEVNPRRLGHVANFARCLALSRNEYVFLSDQDDVWLPHKVERLVQIFEADPSVTLVISAAQLIDEAGAVLDPHWHGLGAERKGRLAALYRLVARGWFYGCACAFRRETLGYVLPFPPDTFAHDIYIGLAHALRGNIYWLDEPLIQYRWHAHNLTPRGKTSFAQKLKRRRVLLGHVRQLMKKSRPPLTPLS